MKVKLGLIHHRSLRFRDLKSGLVVSEEPPQKTLDTSRSKAEDRAMIRVRVRDSHPKLQETGWHQNSIGVFFHHLKKIDPIRSHFCVVIANIKTFPTVY